MESSVNYYNLKFCQECLEKRRDSTSQLENELLLIDDFDISKSLNKINFTLSFVSWGMNFIAFLSTEDPCFRYFLGISCLLLWYSAIDGRKLMCDSKFEDLTVLSEKELNSKIEMLEFQYQKIQEEIKMFEHSLDNVNSDIQNYYRELFCGVTDDIKKVDMIFNEFLNESIDWRNTHLILSKLPKEQYKSLVKTYGKN